MDTFRALRAVVTGLAVCLLSAVGLAQQPAEQGEASAKIDFFEKSVRPVFVEHCQKCHGADKQWGNLRLDSRQALLAGGDRGPAIAPGKPDESLLLQAVRHLDDDLKMPPEGEKLSEPQIAAIARWIAEGAAFPASAGPATRKRDPRHWAFQPPADPPLPAVTHSAWPQQGLDAFILAGLEAANLSPAPPADRRTLARRVTFDLTGLPPAPEEIEAFLTDDSPAALERLVDRLLASPAYGERWGRHWLDVARYSDSNGLDENVAHGNAWRYRDYVVASFNADKPFDTFLREQLAGDLLPAADEPAHNERLVATGFLALGAKVLAEVDEAKMELDIVDEQIDTTGRAFLAMTFGCARCHDHKFDPIDTADYYALAGIFKSSRTMESFKKVARWYENPLPTPASRAAQAEFEAQVARKKADVQQFIAETDAQVKAAPSPGEVLPDNLEAKYPPEAAARLKQLREELAALEKSPPAAPSAMGVAEGTPTDVAICLRGQHLKLGEVVHRAVPRVMAGESPPAFDGASSGRLALADWLANPQHPLTARVIVNRVWRWHFGKGLVRTPDNFGLLGEPPTHPALLDWLARRFIASGWSLKALHRLIVLSSTYQQSSRPDPLAVERDPENRLWGRMDVRRLEAEAVRDALLAVGGRLDRAMGGSLLAVPNRGYLFDHTSKDLTDYGSPRRSLYLPVIRNNLYDVFQLLDFPDAAVPSGDRSTTTVAPQALLMLNSDLVLQAGDALAARLRDECGDDEPARLRRLVALAYGREVTAAETERAQSLLDDVERSLPAGEVGPRRLAAWSCLCQAVLAANEFIYVE